MASKLVTKGGLVALILVFVISSLAQPGYCIYWNWKYHVHLWNRLSDTKQPLFVHVRSKNDDFREQAIWQKDDYQFHFKINFWETTLFYCTFRHGNKVKTFNIFVHGDRWSESKVCKHPNRTVYWRAYDNGFYRSCDNFHYFLMQLW
ncbi:hypothetical protein V6N11_008404 [Hibiscus sabdariffa]|uniref:S-protein homolog n=1 Tax=Hibiscus sabdariffa TaxID=183260 RepID=A0ABR2P877_9ROSI